MCPTCNPTGKRKNNNACPANASRRIREADITAIRPLMAILWGQRVDSVWSGDTLSTDHREIREIASTKAAGIENGPFPFWQSKAHLRAEVSCATAKISAP
jgi:hypothetical protein